MSNRLDPRAALLRELADPLRLRVVDRLANSGEASVSGLAAELGVPLPQLSNHLRRLREAGLVRVRRSGRHAVYALADPGLEALLPLLDRLTGRLTPPPAAPPDTPFARARTCYDHLAGALGVDLYAALCERDALRERPDGGVDLGPAATRTFGALGVDPSALDPGRRRFAFECLDAVHRAPHLGGALGAALAGGLGASGWIHPGDGRVLEVTEAGRRGLRRTLGVRVP
jgi:DNA-binding transcriptional ArsR family regulator